MPLSMHEHIARSYVRGASTLFRDTLIAKAIFLHSPSRKHRASTGASTRLLEDLLGGTQIFVAGAWVLALLNRKRNAFFLLNK